MYILGLNAYHGDAAACLLKDGEIIAAVEEERLTRIKHQSGFPNQAIQTCLEMASIGIEDLDHVAINRDPKAHLIRKAFYSLSRMPSPKLLHARLRNARSWAGIETALAQAFPEQTLHAKIHHIEHHLAHLASAFDPSPFESALVLSVDGFGDFSSAVWGTANNDQINITGRVHFPHSLGLFYQAMTQFLGFPNYGDEYKIMGLAAHGDPTQTPEVAKLVQPRRDGGYRLTLKYFRHHRKNVPYQWDKGAPVAGRLFSPALEALLGPARHPDAPLEQHHKDFAASVQAVYEQALFRLVNALSKRHSINALALAGGCAQNSLANGKLTANTPIQSLYVPSAAADAGGAIGAALATWRKLTNKRAPLRLNRANLGPEHPSDSITQAINHRQIDLNSTDYRIRNDLDTSELCATVAKMIADGQVIGWYQGGMEWGPRALGARSILADPRRDDMRALLNSKIKLREGFRPFAPSVLAESISAWFETQSPQDEQTPFMARVLPVRRERRTQVPAITHIDGTGRLQSVTHTDNPRYYQLITAYQAITGIPMLLNTSFNENEPIVNTPEEALDCFLRTRMDAIALGNTLIERTTS